MSFVLQGGAGYVASWVMLCASGVMLCASWVMLCAS